MAESQDDSPDETSEEGGREKSAAPALLPLTPDYIPAQHQVYLHHLNAALDDDRIRNIALSGRYGSGKSSVLAKFAAEHRDRVLTLSLSTLGPAKEGETQTQEIERELVKQLLHSRSPKDLPQSRYKRIESLDPWRTIWTSAVGLVVVGLLLWLTGLFPDLAGFSSDHGWQVKAGSLVAFAAASVAITTWIRYAVHNRVISSVSAGGASITLSDKDDSYFDEYLDEIVYYFDTLPVDIVVFEDLDRFNNPQIFEALRELNGLLNAPGQVTGKPMRFVYALRDSIFEQLGYDTQEEDDDAARAEAVRANRTKFFELVIPIVPFITPRSSRDHLTRLLKDETLVPIDPELIDLVAGYVTEMRLLKNIRNEYSVFAKRLITDGEGVPDLRPEALFAMIVYKNLHLEDFERVLLGKSALDNLYTDYRQLVSASIRTRRARLRQIATSKALAAELQAKAGTYTDQLTWYITGLARESGHHSLQITTYTVGGEQFQADQGATSVLWEAVLADGNGMHVTLSAPHQGPWSVLVSMEDLRRLLPESFTQEDWDGRERAEIESEEQRHNDAINLLRSADFADLAARDDFTMARGEEQISFERLLQDSLSSEVAKELVRHGFVDQNYALYAAQYYGDRVTVRAMNFIVQHIQPNKPDTYYTFPGSDDIPVLLRETKGAFLDQDSAYNIEILDHLLEHGAPGATTILNRVAGNDGDAEQDFLNTYLNEGIQASRAVQQLAGRWPQVFVRLVESDVPGVGRRQLLDAALPAANRDVEFATNEAVRGFIAETYEHLESLTTSHPADQNANTAKVLERVGFVCPDLAVLDAGVRKEVVASRNFALTAPNLRSALNGPESLALDIIRDADTNVYGFCIKHPEGYLAAAGADDNTNATIAEPAVFPEIVSDVADWDTEPAARLFADAAPECRIESLSDAPSSTWPALARSRRMSASLTNIRFYIDESNRVDEDLGGLLADAGSVEIGVEGDIEGTPVDDVKAAIALSIIGARDTIPKPEDRVLLVVSLDLAGWVDPSQIQPENGHLLGLLIEYKVCDDTATLFERFAGTDWATLEYAIARSEAFASFMHPTLLDEPRTEQLLSSTAVDDAIKIAVLGRLDEFTPSNHAGALRAAAQAAIRTRKTLPYEQISRIAGATSDAALVFAMIDQLGDQMSVDQAVAAIGALGGKHTQITVPGAEFTIDKDDHSIAVLTRLKEAEALSVLTVRRKTTDIDIVVAS